MYPPLQIGDRLRIVPPGTPAAGDGRLELVMERGPFGSGAHETTASCLQLLAELPQVRGARLLDLGSGTGILAIAALRLGAKSALCVDINPQAVATSRRNGELNGVGARMRHHAGVLADVGQEGFDLIVANIFAELLLDLAPGLVARARPGALLLLSGVLAEHNPVVCRGFEHLGCELVDNRMLEQFSTLLLRTP